MASHKGPRSGSPGRPPPDDGNLSAERVEVQTVERCAGIPLQWRPVVMEDDKDDASSDFFTSLVSAGSAYLNNWTEIHHPLGTSTGHQWARAWQGFGPEQFSEEGTEVSTKARDNLSDGSVSSNPLQAVLSHQHRNSFAWYPYWHRERTARYLLSFDPSLWLFLLADMCRISSSLGS